jgi:hypothetical protein
MTPAGSTTDLASVHDPGPAQRVTVIGHAVIKSGISCRNAVFMIRE